MLTACRDLGDQTCHDCALRSCELSAVVIESIALKRRNVEHGHDLLMSVQSPSLLNTEGRHSIPLRLSFDDRYPLLRHWTPKQAPDFFSPSEQSMQATREWLAESGIHPSKHSVTPGRGSIKFTATA